MTYTDDEWPGSPENGDAEADYDYDDWVAGSGWAEPANRTEALITRGRPSAPRSKLKGRRAAARRVASARFSPRHLPAGLLAGVAASAPASAGTAGTTGRAGAARRPGGAGGGTGPGFVDAPGFTGPRPSPGGHPVIPRPPGKAGKLSRRHLIVVGAAALVLGVVLAIVLPGPGASWPASVAVVKQQIQAACQNPDIASDPGQVNFACAKEANQVLWVFALLTSGDNPHYSDSATGRVGLEPITPAQGGNVALLLNLHHPYNPASATDSLAVAARAINNIIGGATVTGQNGAQVVQPGLESTAGNCARYTGSAALITRTGFPSVCAKPVTTAGEAALVSDVYGRWMVGAPSQEAANAATLFSNAGNPGNARVQAILRSLAGAGR
ncbi:MAG TPA: hypothetical protein VH478_05025 [Trebonia sp.]|nr:hypothetical protein [Trebonia sp.]